MAVFSIFEKTFSAAFFLKKVAFFHCQDDIFSVLKNLFRETNVSMPAFIRIFLNFAVKRTFAIRFCDLRSKKEGISPFLSAICIYFILFFFKSRMDLTSFSPALNLPFSVYLNMPPQMLPH